MVNEAKIETTESVLDQKKYNSSSSGYRDYIISEYFAMREYEVQLMDEISRSGAPKNRIRELEKLQKTQRRQLREYLPQEYQRIEELRDQIMTHLLFDPSVREAFIGIKEQLKSEHTQEFTKSFERVLTASVYPEKLNEGDPARVIHRYPGPAVRYYEQLTPQVLRLQALNEESIESAEQELKDIIEKNLKDMGYPTGVSLLVQSGEMDAYIRDALALYGATLYKLQEFPIIDFDGSLHKMVLKDAAVSLIKSRFAGIILELGRAQPHIEVLVREEIPVSTVSQSVVEDSDDELRSVPPIETQPDLRKEEDPVVFQPVQETEFASIPVTQVEEPVAVEVPAVAEDVIAQVFRDVDERLKAVREEEGEEIPGITEEPKVVEEARKESDSKPEVVVRPASWAEKRRFGKLRIGGVRWADRRITRWFRRSSLPVILSLTALSSLFAGARYYHDLWNTASGWFAVDHGVSSEPKESPLVPLTPSERLVACYEKFTPVGYQLIEPDNRSVAQKQAQLKKAHGIDLSVDPSTVILTDDLVRDLISKAPDSSLREGSLEKTGQRVEIISKYLQYFNEPIEGTELITVFKEGRGRWSFEEGKYVPGKDGSDRFKLAVINVPVSTRISGLISCAEDATKVPD